MDLEEKLQFYKEIKEKLKQIENDINMMDWEFTCKTCNMKGFVFHHLDLFDHSIRYYCRGCASAGKIAERDKKKVHNYLKSCLGISGDFEMSFIVDSDNRRV